MDIQPQSTQPISDDQELAKVLAGVNTEGDSQSGVPPVSDVTPPVADGLPPIADPVVSDPAPEAPMLDYVATPLPTTPAPTPSTGNSELDSVKSQAINELRPLVTKLTLPPEEKFDTYLLLIRSTDDQSLIAPAHAAAREISDEARRAQALLDIIKEIDFLSGQTPTA